MLQRYKRGIALILAFSLIQEIIFPTMAMALTGGPSQPEVESFEPVGTNQMVDLSTGDFTYNIPLMVVPGPNGSYPINLAYHAGIGMEQEASWVGLGWNINPGAITRNMRGIPDDFKGDEIKQTVSMRNDVTVGLGANMALFKSTPYKEVMGVIPAGTKGGGQMRVYYNVYRGVGYNISAQQVNIWHSKFRMGRNVDKSISTGFSFDSQTGLGISPALNLTQYSHRNDKEMKVRGFGVGFNIHSREGVQSLFVNREKKRSTESRTVSEGSISFATSSYVPGNNLSMKSNSYQLEFSLDKKMIILGTHSKKKEVKVDFQTSEIAQNTRRLKGYGTIYLENQETGLLEQDDPDKITDVNLYNDIPISRSSKNMGAPIMTSDVYIISGQGIGGTFRPHRTDIGILANNANTSTSNTFSLGTEYASSPLPPPAPKFRHIGADPAYGRHDSYSGKWIGGDEQISNLKFQDKSFSNPKYEPFYFKQVGEQTATSLNHFNYQKNDNPIAFDMGLKTDDDGLEPIVKSNLYRSSDKFNTLDKSRKRVKRVQNIEYNTNGELKGDQDYINRPDHIYVEGQYPDGVNGDQIDYAANGKEHHFGEYSILKSDGTRYTYGLPAYNTLQKEKVFSSVDENLNDYVEKERTTYDSDDASINNDEGVDNYFSETETPAYIHANLLTEITSHDYVDLTNDGPTEDDFGFYTKFNYQAVNDYQWRFPYQDAQYIKGTYSNELDDKASYTYGRKNLYYVHSVETKTHVAIFELGDRKDGKGVTSENQTSSTTKGKSQKYLKKITLYSKRDVDEVGLSSAIPLQTVELEYSYELCKNIDNNDGNPINGVDADSFTSSNNEGGKLTLKKVYISYNGNSKGRLSPYEFNYDNNPDYHLSYIDRWGNYQEALGDPLLNIQNPYTRQDDGYSNRNVNAGAWSLTDITLPSGGTMEVEYEADDYGHVQDKRAMQMTEVYGFSETDEIELPSGPDKLRLSRKKTRLWFKMNESFPANADKEAIVKDYVDGIDEAYFKVFEELKIKYNLSAPAKDYVVGYAKIDNTSYGFDASNDNYAYVDLEIVSYKSAFGSLFKTHPFRKAGWQYMRFSRPDLFYNQNAAGADIEDLTSSLLSIPATLGTAFSDAVSIVTMGYYNKAALFGYAKTMDEGKPSFIRLNAPNSMKYGGGHRIASIKLNDNWVEGEHSYGQEYSYNNEDGTTSGVADYEPFVGGEENCLKNPIWYDAAESRFQTQEAYIETPIMEAVYPGARVIYGRVIENNLTNNNVEKTQDGIKVHEFYTAKDFPVYENQSSLSQSNFNISFTIPFIGSQTIQKNGYSQGYSVVTNDMSGRPKSSATYPYRTGGELKGNPVSKVEYIYQTDLNGRLSNKVQVLDGHGEVRTAEIGVEQDISLYEHENKALTVSGGTEINVELTTIPAVPPVIIPFPISIPNASSVNSTYRGISTSKVIHKTGVLSEVKVYNDGSMVSTKNLIHDAETGEALLTSVTNEFDKPVFNYNYPAHWAYDGMKGAYNNYRANVSVRQANGNNYEIIDADPSVSVLKLSDLITPGDELRFNESSTYKTYFVTTVNYDANTFTLEDQYGIAASFNRQNGVISRSGHRNLQSVKNGEVVALSTSFFTNQNQLFPYFELWNAQILGQNPQANIEEGSETYFNLNNMEVVTKPINHNAAQLVIHNASIYCSCFDDVVISASLSSRTINFTPLGTYPDCELSDNMVTNSGCNYQLDFTTGPFFADNFNPFDLGYITSTTVDDGNGGTLQSFTEQLKNFEIIGVTDNISNPDRPLVKLKYLPTGEVFEAYWGPTLGGGDCFCEENSDILHASAVTFKDDYGMNYPLADLGNPKNEAQTPINNASLNPYRYGKKGIWRVERTHLYQIAREQSGAAGSFKTQIDKDGLYESWKPYDWKEGATNEDWDWVSEMTAYSPYGFGIEERSRLSNGDLTIYSSQMYGYDNSVVVAQSQLASYFEIGYRGFEQPSSYQGHLNFGANLTAVSTTSHTGKKSLPVSNGRSLSFPVWSIIPSETIEIGNQQLRGIAGKKYIASMWVNVNNAGTLGTLTIEDGSSNVITQINTNTIRGSVIDGWKKLELAFTMPNSGLVRVKYSSTGQTYIDDLRFGPFSGGMVTYVYDTKNLWLVSELDALNYATFYNYDEEGNLVQVKKETETGIVTIQTSRSNTKQLPTP